MMGELEEIHRLLRQFQKVVAEQMNEAVTLAEQGYRVPVPWVAILRDVLEQLLAPAQENLSSRNRMLWQLGSLQEHLRYYQDRDLEWSTVWNDSENVAIRLEMLRKSRKLENRLQTMTEEEVDREIAIDRETGLR
jgi:hypothetical protein